MAWTCWVAALIEQDPSETTKEPHVWDIKFPYFSTPPSYQPHLDLIFPESHPIIQWWYETVEAYSLRGLTYEKDRLPTLEGLAREFSVRTGYHYHQGIWKEDHLRGLLWRSRSRRSTREEQIPSWSWAASIHDHTDPENPRGIFYDISRLASRRFRGQPSELMAISELNLTLMDLVEDNYEEVF